MTAPMKHLTHFRHNGRDQSNSTNFDLLKICGTVQCIRSISTCQYVVQHLVQLAVHHYRMIVEFGLSGSASTTVDGAVTTQVSTQ